MGIEKMRNLVECFDRAFSESLCPAGSLEASENADVCIKESSKKFTVALRVPGYDKGDLQVEATSRGLTITGSRSPGQGERERFTRSYALPAEVRRDQISARLEDGTLIVELPKARETTARRVAIE